jgi:hypothetical protein
MRFAVALLLLVSCADLSKLDDFSFVDPMCEPESVDTSCFGVECGTVLNNCNDEVVCPSACTGVQQCEVGDAPANTCGCSTAANVPTPGSGCLGHTSNDDGTRAYYVCPKEEFEQARLLCQGFGTDLVIIGDQVENEFVRALIPPMDANAHLGLWAEFCQAPAGTACKFAWIDGSAPSYVNWGGMGIEPNNSQGAENCTEMRQQNGEWNDVGCGSRRHVICETTCP